MEEMTKFCLHFCQNKQTLRRKKDTAPIGAVSVRLFQDGFLPTGARCVRQMEDDIP